MIDKFEHKGYWYLPSNPTNKIAGIMTYVPNKSITLELFGTFEKSDNKILDFTKKEDLAVIWGSTSGGHKISLIYCTPNGGSYSSNSDFPIKKYSISYCLEGIYIGSPDDKIFSSGNIMIPELTKWYHPNALKIVPGNISVDTCKITTPIASIEVNDSTILHLKRHIRTNLSEDGLNPTFQQNTILNIEKKTKTSIFDFLSNVSLFEEFMSLTTLSTISVSTLYLYSENINCNLKHERDIDKSIKLFYKQNDAGFKGHKYDFLIYYHQIEDILGSVIKKWYEDSSKINPIRRHLIQSIKTKNTFDSTDFLIVIQAIEGFCVRFRKEQSLKKILEDIICEFDNVDKIKQSQIDVKATVNSRHYYSHFIDKNKRPKVLDGEELFDLTRKLRTLLICCVLNFIGLENKRINNILNSSYNWKLY